MSTPSDDVDPNAVTAYNPAKASPAMESASDGDSDATMHVTANSRAAVPVRRDKAVGWPLSYLMSLSPVGKIGLVLFVAASVAAAVAIFK